MKERAQLHISGNVQGVGFRYYTEREARRLRLSGWVRNLPDGEVEVLAEGTHEDLERLIDWCHEGPPSARVSAVRVQWAPATGEFSDFRSRH